MTEKELLEEEQRLVEEINFFNKNVEWWVAEFEKIDKKLRKIEDDHFIASSSEIDKLLAQAAYLAGKAKTEQKTADVLFNKKRKLLLRKELYLIQGDFNSQGKKKNK